MTKILMIEDNLHYAMVTQHLLEANGYEVVHADNGKKGLQEAKNIVPDLILLDLIMPVMDGFQTLKEIKKDEDLREIPILILTSRDDDKSLRDAMAAQATTFLNKNDEPETILEKIKKALDIRGTF